MKKDQCIYSDDFVTVDNKQWRLYIVAITDEQLGLFLTNKNDACYVKYKLTLLAGNDLKEQEQYTMFYYDYFQRNENRGNLELITKNELLDQTNNFINNNTVFFKAAIFQVCLYLSTKIS